MELFTQTTRTYKTRNNAKKVIDNLIEEGHNFHWTIATLESGRFYPLIILSGGSSGSMHYYIEKGCCVFID